MLRMKFQIPSTKSQTNPKLQAGSPKTRKGRAIAGVTVTLALLAALAFLGLAGSRPALAAKPPKATPTPSPTPTPCPVVPSNPYAFAQIPASTSIQPGNINIKGEVVGFFSDPWDGDFQVFLWLPAPAYGLPAGFNNLGTMGQKEAASADITDAGEILGAAWTKAPHGSPNDVYRAFIWQNNTTQFIDGITGVGSINNRRQIGGGANGAWVWDAAVGQQWIGPPPGCTGSDGTVINDLGMLGCGSTCQPFVVVPEDGNGDGRADKWVRDSDGDGYNDLIQGLGTFGGSGGYVRSINSLGQAAGYTRNASGVNRAFVVDPKDSDADAIPDLWFLDANGDGTNDLLLDLGTLGGTLSDARAINNLGDVVGSSRISPATTEIHPFIIHPEDTDGDGKPDRWYRDDNQDGANDLMVDLLPYFPCVWSSISVRGFNDLGQIVGLGRLNGGPPRAFLLTPVQAPTP